MSTYRVFKRPAAAQVTSWNLQSAWWHAALPMQLQAIYMMLYLISPYKRFINLAQLLLDRTANFS